MTDEIVAPDDGAQKKPFIIFRIAQWGAFAFSLVVVLGTLLMLDKTSVPSVNATSAYAVLFGSVVAAAFQFPKAFWRLSRKLRWFAYAVLVGSFACVVNVSSQIRSAYLQTPQGAAEAAANAKTDALLAKSDAIARDADARVAAAADAKEASAEYNRQLDKCFSYFGHKIPALADQVRDSLENPSSFEHVRTEKMGDSQSLSNIEMYFRAENGFGATRTVSVQAKVNPYNCSVSYVSKIYD